jgi:Na+/H+ antiporter NhaD/arsenite permease-like protein
MGKLFRNIFFFYYDGFRSMTIGKKLWLVVLIKLFIILIVLKLFFFRDFLSSRFDTDEQKSEYVIKNLTNCK